MPKKKRRKTEEPKDPDEQPATSCEGFLTTKYDALLEQLIEAGDLVQPPRTEFKLPNDTSLVETRDRLSRTAQGILFNAITEQTAHGQGTVEFTSYVQHLGTTTQREDGTVFDIALDRNNTHVLPWVALAGMDKAALNKGKNFPEGATPSNCVLLREVLQSIMQGHTEPELEWSDIAIIMIATLTDSVIRTTTRTG